MTQISTINTVSEVKKRSAKESFVNKFDIPIDHLDFAYVKSCNDGKELEQIVQILRSGEEGYFPDLLKCVEERLYVVKPKSKLLQTAVRVLTEQDMAKSEWNKMSFDIQDWIDGIQNSDRELASFRAMKTSNEVPVRQSKSCEKKNEVKKMARIKAMDYESWDKLDVDAEILKMDLKEDRMKEDTINKQKGIEQLNTVVLDPDVMSEVELSHAALEAKNRGNDSFSLGDYEEALQYYSNSIAILPLTVTFNNRAITNIKLKKYHDALNDCKKVFESEPCDEKALYRMALASKSLKLYVKACQHLERLLQINPSNTDAQNLMHIVKSKIGHVKPARTVRMKIQDEKQTEVLIPIPGTSKYPGPYYKVLHVSENIAEQIENTNKTRVKLGENVIDLGCSDKSQERSFKYNAIKLQEKQNEIIKLKMGKTESSFAGQEETNNCDKKREQGACNGRLGETESENIICNKGSDDEVNVLSCGEPGYAFEIDYEPRLFLTYLQSLKHDRHFIGLEKLLRLANPIYLPTVLGCKLDNVMFTEILNCLHKRFCNADDAEFLSNILTQLIKVTRLNIILMFLSNQEKHTLQSLFAFIKRHGHELKPDVFAKYCEFL